MKPHRARRRRAPGRISPSAGSSIELLESRTLLSGNLHVTSVSIVDGNDNPIANPVIGTQIYVQVNFTATDLPANTSYTISQTLYGQTKTDTVSYGAGYSGTTNWYQYWGSWTVQHSGVVSATVSLDSTNTVAETSESDNTGSVSFTPTQMPLPELLAQPLDATAFRDYGYVNYVDEDLTSPGFHDYRGGPYTYDGHDAIDMTFPTFQAMDQGTPVLAAAAGTVIAAVDGNFDRNTVGNGNANFVTIDYGNGWKSDYYHLRNGSVGVQVGQHVVAGQVIGLMGSSGNSSAPHLHFSLYNGESISTYRNPSAYWQNPLPYQGDVDEVVDSGITSYDPSAILNSEERPPETRALRQESGLTVYDWFVSYNAPNEPINVTFTRPDGTVYASQTFNSGSSPNRGGYYYYGWNLPATPDLGAWTATVSINGVRMRSDVFNVTSIGGPVAEITQGSNLIANGRTTPIDDGIFAQGSTPGVQSFVLKNLGTDPLGVGNLVAPPGWKVVTAPISPLQPGASEVFSLQPDSSLPGYRYGFASLVTDDPAATNYRFALSATVNPAGSTPTVALISRDTSASEAGLDPGVFRIVRSGGNLAAPLTVFFNESGTATPGSDFVALPNSVVIPANQTSVSVIITPIDDSSPESTETVALTLAQGNYTAAPQISDVVSIADNDSGGTASISGTVYLDQNFNTYRDTGEPAVSGVQLFIDYNADDIHQADEPMITTSSTGLFGFGNLPAGHYPLREITSSGYILTTPVGSITVAAGQNLRGQDIGVFPDSFTGTTGNDTFSVSPAATSNRELITVNGVTYNAIRSQMPSLTFNGGDGNDVLSLDGATIDVPPGLVAATPITFDGGAAKNILKLVDTQSNQDLTVAPNQLQLRATTVAFTNTASVQLDGAYGSLISLLRVTLDGGTLALTPGRNMALHASDLTVTGNGWLDLADNDLILQIGPVGTWNGSAYNGVSGMVAAGMIRSSHESTTTMLGVALASDALGLGAGQTGAFDGAVVFPSDVLVKFTYRGDANLDGKINIDDYGRIDANVGQSGAVFGWYNGDFNFDGKINIDDYGLIDSVIGAQGPVL